jgi:hypothetical protein
MNIYGASDGTSSQLWERVIAPSALMEACVEFQWFFLGGEGGGGVGVGVKGVAVSNLTPSIKCLFL